MCARKPTWVRLIYRTEPTTKKCKTENQLDMSSVLDTAQELSVGLGLGGSVHEEAHPCFPYLIQTSFKGIALVYSVIM